MSHITKFKDKLPHGSVQLIIAVMTLLTMISSCSRAGKETKKAEFPIPVEIAEVIQQDTPLYVEGIGNAVAYNTVDVKSRVTGELIKTFFKQGDQLTESQPLFMIDPAPFEAKVKEVEAKLNQAKVQYVQAKREYERFRTLYSERAVSQEQLETKEVDMNAKLYQMHLHEAELENARLNLSYCHIQCPLDGESGEIFIDNFNIVTANQDKLVTIRQVRPIKVKFSVPGKYLDQIKAYNAETCLEVEAYIQGSDKPEIGKLSLIDNNINPKTGMIMLEGAFPNNDKRLWPGQFVKVRLKLTVTRNAVLVPEQAVNVGPEGKYVWLVGEDSKVSMRPVKLNRRVGSMEVISEGLKASDRVVIAGQLMLRPEATVITKEQMQKARVAAGEDKQKTSAK